MIKKGKRHSKNDSKFNNLWIKNNLWILLLLLIVIIFITAISLVTNPLGHNIINNEKNTIFPGEWQYAVDGGEMQTVQLPHSEKIQANSIISLHNKLPSEIIKGATLLVRTSQQDLIVKVDGEVIYDSVKESGISSSSYHFIRLPTNSSGKDVEVILSSRYDRYSGLMSQIYLGSKASHIFFLVAQNGFNFIIGLLIFIVGIITMTAFLFVKDKKRSAQLVFLGAFFVCAGFWLLSESKMLQFIIPSTLSVTNISIYGLSLIPLFFGLYVFNSHRKEFEAWGKYIIIIFSLASVAIAIIACINPLVPLVVLPYYLICIGVFIICMIAAIAVDGIRKKNLMTLPMIGVLVFCVCCLIELISVAINLYGYNSSKFFVLGLLLFCIFLTADAIRSFIKAYQSSLQVETLKRLAYTDSLTGVKNRVAFLEKMEGYDNKQEGFFTVAMYDVNDLKIVNDRFGHMAGDALLRQSASILQKSLKQNGELYRIGGDEFAAIFLHNGDLNIDEIENNIVNYLKEENIKPRNHMIWCAYGYATFDGNIDITIFDTLKRADEKMYECKKNQKKFMLDKN